MIAVRRALDRITGRVTMYRLVTVLLAALAVAAVLLSLIGQVSFPPGALLASAAAALFGTVGSNAVVALALRTRPHTESSVITGLLVFFLLFPSTDAADLWRIALAGALATVSKYVLAWRGRHILNPAATGVALIAVAQLDGAVWWVATSALLPLVAVGALLVLYRTRRLPMAAIFIVVSATAVVVRLTSSGPSVTEAITTAFVSYPIVFFAGFMLSEPLTMPPRRWQQYLLAVVVGVLFAVPYVIGPVILSFEVALLVGNALSFLVGQRRSIRLELIDTRALTPTSWELRFRPEHPVAFRAGQYMELTVPHARPDQRGSRRIFSVASAPRSAGNSDGPVSFALRMTHPASSFKRALVALEPGARVRATSVGGDFLLPRNTAAPVLLIAGGIGITPFLSQLDHDRAEGHERDAVLVYEVSSVDELAFTDRLADDRVLLVSPEPPAELPPSWRWIGPGPMTADLIREAVPDAASRTAYLSGAPSLIESARAILRRVGVRRVVTDYFSGY